MATSLRSVHSTTPGHRKPETRSERPQPKTHAALRRIRTAPGPVHTDLCGPPWSATTWQAGFSTARSLQPCVRSLNLTLRDDTTCPVPARREIHNKDGGTRDAEPLNRLTIRSECDRDTGTKAGELSAPSRRWTSGWRAALVAAVPFVGVAIGGPQASVTAESKDSRGRGTPETVCVKGRGTHPNCLDDAIARARKNAFEEVARRMGTYIVTSSGLLKTASVTVYYKESFERSQGILLDWRTTNAHRACRTAPRADGTGQELRCELDVCARAVELPFVPPGRRPRFEARLDDPDGVVAEGEDFELLITPSEPLYIYILAENQRGELQLIMPNDDLPALARPWPARRSLRFPSGHPAFSNLQRAGTGMRARLAEGADKARDRFHVFSTRTRLDLTPARPSGKSADGHEATYDEYGSNVADRFLRALLQIEPSDWKEEIVPVEVRRRLKR